MSHSQTVSLYFGDDSSHMGAHHWNIQHNLLNCAEENDFLDTDQIFIERKGHHYSPMTLFFNLNADEYAWNKFSKFRYSPKSFCKVPLWKNAQPFDSCFQGARIKGGDFAPVISQEVWDNVFIDNFRHMAEQCDYLKHLSITVDCFDAFGGVASSYMEQLMDEMLSPSVAMSFTCLTAPLAKPPTAANAEYFSSKQNTSLSRLNVPYTLAALTEVSSHSLVLPLDFSGVAAQVRAQIQQRRQYDRLQMAAQGDLSVFERILPDDEKVEEQVRYRTSLFAASCMETVTGGLRLAPARNVGMTVHSQKHGSSGSGKYSEDFDQYGYDGEENGDEYGGGGDNSDDDEPNADDTADVREWINKATANGQYPVCNLEIHVPHSYSVFPPSVLGSGAGNNSSLLEYIRQSYSIFDGGDGAENDTRVTHEASDSGSGRQRVYDYNYINPCMNVQVASAVTYARQLRSRTRLSDDSAGEDDDGGDYSDSSSAAAFLLNNRRVERPYTNMLSVRGTMAPELQVSLYSKCINSNFLVNDITMRRAAIPMDKKESVGILSCMLSRQLTETTTTTTTNSGAGSGVVGSSPGININSLVDTIWNSTGNTLHSFLYCTGVGAVGADRTIEPYLGHLEATWSQSTLSGVYRDASSHGGDSMQLLQGDYQSSSSEHTAFQLAKYGIDQDDCKHVSEVLMSLRARYSDQESFNM